MSDTAPVRWAVWHPMARLRVCSGDEYDYPVPCEQCGTLTQDWRSVGFFCSDACKDKYARLITL